MLLERILNGINFKTDDVIAGLDIHNVTDDSRAVGEGDVFVAVRGYSVDGHKFIDEVIAKKVSAVIAEKDFAVPGNVKKILVSDTRSAFPMMLDNFYKQPSKALKVIGVTGTNGKTTITYLIENILREAHEGSAVIGTINYRLKNKVIPSKNTTPGPRQLQAMLAKILKDGMHYVVMEVSSHSLDQHRVDGVSFDAAIFTNITSEHLDYHKTIDDYFKAKVLLFDRLKDGGAAILNNDDERVGSLKGSINKRVITYGIKNASDVTAKNIRLSLDGSAFTAETPVGPIDLQTRLIGMHNVSNVLAAVAASFSLGIDPETVKKGIGSMSYVPGRLEPVEAGQGFKVFVDYAHTEDALNNILSLLRDVAKKNIITVFGCGGNRDRKKRPEMGKAACKFSDRVIITSDNPRFEEPRQIIDEIEGGVRGQFTNYDIVVDRLQAIEKALSMARDQDIVVIAGKGHEDYQIIKDKIMPFDDRKVVLEILKRSLAGALNTNK